MKKKILISFSGSMDLGGIERSLLGLLDSIDYDKYDVDLFLYSHHGPLFHLINPKVNILPEYVELAYLRESFITKVKKGAFYSAYRRMVDGVNSKHYDTDQSWAKVLQYVKPTIDKEYDLALGFFLPFDLLRDFVHAKVKVGWIHTDYSKEMVLKEALIHGYSGMDYIAAVSEATALAFVKCVPEYTDKVIVLENILSKSFVEQQSVLTAPEWNAENSTLKLLSIGRFTNAKNFDNVPYICRKIVEAGLNVKWYIIGFGNDEELIRTRIIEAQMEDYVFILGKKNNPYPYIKGCDLYVQPSRYEGKCVAVREAQLLCKPVVITNYSTASSQVIDGEDGVIVPMDNDGCAAGIIDVLRNSSKRKALSTNCKKKDYTNFEEVRKICALMG